MTPSAKIRGIYATAITRLFLDAGYRIADPSPETRRRFGLVSAPAIPDLSVKDREDHQGIDILGEADRVCRAVTSLQGKLLDAVLLSFEPLGEGEKELLDDLKGSQEVCRARLELGGASKEALDRIRATVLPTLAFHHRLRIVHPLALEKAEEELLDHPRARRRLSESLFQETVLGPLAKAGTARLEHVKARGKPVRPREGILLEAGAGRILLKRSFTQGRYDGLDLPIEPGDYGLTEACEGAWQVKNAYFSKDGKLKGEYYNVNTPVELYPYGARYIDLEIDVVRKAGGKAFLLDREKLDLLAQEGKISRPLEKKAREAADRLMEELGRRRGPFAAPEKKKARAS